LFLVIRCAVAQQGAVAGVIKAINGNTITLTTDAGADVSVQLAGDTKIVRVVPGEKDLRNATPIQLSDLQPGDRILVRGQPSGDAKSFAAAGIIALKRSDVEAGHAHEREDWQKRGVGGLVKAVDPATGTITISTVAAGGARTVAIHPTKSTILRRYSSGSVKFDDAKPAPIDQIKTGDQLRARGTRSADGNEFAAEEIVSGSFRNIAGTITSVDANANTMQVMDLIAKKPVMIKITDQSQLRKLPPEVAQRIALRLKRPAGASDATGPKPATAGAPGPPSSGQADFQQIVNRMPHAAIGDFQKGDAVMTVSTEGTDPAEVTAITLLGGVEPILAAPSGSQAMTLSPWSLGSAPGESEASP
jgi:hypothetical protein